MHKCIICEKEGIGISKTLGVCIDCIRKRPEDALSYIKEAHRKIRERFNLPAEPPKNPDGISCNLCANECRIGINQRGYCGLRKNVDGRLIQPKYALVHTYTDPLPTNCCASWFCPGSKDYGCVNFAVFFYACNFNCIFCQNYSHKFLENSEKVTADEFVERVINNKKNFAKQNFCAQSEPLGSDSGKKISCICYFGGSPEPQLPFAIRASEIVFDKCKVRICWEWNGCGNENLVRRAAELSFRSDGIVKFDLKAFDPNLGIALSGVPNERAYKNFRMIADEFFNKRELPMLTATTLLVPEYVDKIEVEGIARFISELNPEIPYSLLVFHPEFYMDDMPITPRRQVDECYNIAKKYLRNVNVGNLHLLGSFGL